MPSTETPPPPASNPKPASNPNGRRIGATVFVALSVTAMGARYWLSRQEAERRDQMFRSLAESTRDTDRKLAQQAREEDHRRVMAELERSQAQLDAMKYKFEPIVPLRPSGAKPTVPPVPTEPTEPTAPPVIERMRATEKPGAMVVADADISVSTLRLAPAKAFRDRAAKKELETSLVAVHNELRTALDGKQQFADPQRVATLLPRVEAALARLNETMVPGELKTMALTNVTDLRNDLRDFAASVDGGAR